MSSFLQLLDNNKALLIVSLLIGIMLIIENIGTEKKEAEYFFKTIPLFTDSKKLGSFQERCLKSYTDIADETDLPEEEYVNKEDIQRISTKGENICLLEYIKIPANIALILFETVNLPLKATIPYEIFKSSLLKNNSQLTRCSDVIEEYAKICPSTVRLEIESR
jgi:hypothetical protein